MSSSFRMQSLLDREGILESSASTVPPLRTSKSECPFSVEIEAKDGGDDVRLTSRSWSFSLTTKKRQQQQKPVWPQGHAEYHPCSNSVELVPVNSSSESDDSFSVHDEEDPIVVLVEEEDEETSVTRKVASLPNQQIQKTGSHPLATALERSKSTTTEQQQQQDANVVCAYDCFADHITSILCPVERHHIETSSHKNLPLEESSASVCSSHTTHVANNTSVCDPDVVQMQLFPPSTEIPEDDMDRSSFLFSSFNFWDSSAEEAERLRRKRWELRQQRTPTNRSRYSKKLRDQYLQHMLDTWHPPFPDEESCWGPTTYSSDNASSISLSTKSRMLKRSKSLSRRCKIRITLQQKNQVCYDSDPEQAFSGKRQRKASLLQSPKRASSSRSNSSSSPVNDPFQSSMSLHVGVVGEDTNDASTSSDVTSNSRRSVASGLSISTDGDCSTSFETARNHSIVQPPLAPRHGDRISFDFVTTDSDRNQNGGEVTAEESILTPSRNSTTSLSTSDGDAGEDTAPEEQSAPAVTATESSFLSDGSGASLQDEEDAAEARKRPSQQMHMPLPVRCEPPFFQAPTQWTEFHLLYSGMDDFTKSHVQELSNVRFPLIWHPPANKKDAATAAPSKTRPPVACHGVFEVGAHLDQMVVQPKFTWSPVLQPNLEEDRKILLSGSQPHSVELLSIIRVNTPSPYQRPSLMGNGWDRSLYPFCRLDRTVCVTTNDLNHPYLVFEAQSTSERDWLVVALKLIVARLASIIIVRDEDMLLEFFSPYSALLQLEDDDDSDDEFEEAENSKKVVSARDALESLTLGKKPNRSPIQTIARDEEEDGHRQDVSLDDDDDDLSTDDEAED
jgi:hypothetical protein